MKPPTFTPSQDPAIQEIQTYLLQLTMNITEQLNATKARFVKAFGEVSTRIAALNAALEAAVKSQQDQAAAVASGEVVPASEIITPEIIALSAELADLAQRFDELVADPEPEPVTFTEELPPATEPPGE
jgi:hypothetical protein